MNELEDTVMDYRKIQEKLLLERRTRITMMILLLAALIFTIIYGTIQNPFQYTFSKIGNRFDPALRYVFITWSLFTGLAIQASIIALFKLENYENRRHYLFIYVGVLFLVLTALLPSLDKWPLFQDLHIVAGVVFALFITMGFLPFMRWVAMENPRLRRSVYIWLGVIWVGSISFMIIFGNTGLFELFFFCTFIIFLLYITLSLFEEQIIKRSVRLLSGHEDLNRGIEEIFFPEFMKKKRESKRLKKLKEEKANS